MKITKLIEKIKPDIRALGDEATEVTGCYIGDLMSLAMAHVEEGNAWITIQTNQNVIAVAALKEAACVILADGNRMDSQAADKAAKEGICVLESEKSAYALALQLGELGV